MTFPSPLPPSAEHSFLASDHDDPPVTVIREIRVRPGQEAKFEELMSELTRQAVLQPGHLGSTVVRPIAHGHAYRFIYKFTHRSLLMQWQNSELRAKLAAPVAPLIETDRYDEYPGLETWFDLVGTLPAPKWKTTLLSWFAIYPTVIVLSYIFKALKFHPPVPIFAFVLTIVVVPSVAYIFAPWLGKRLHWWLYASPARTHKQVHTPDE